MIYRLRNISAGTINVEGISIPTNGFFPFFDSSDNSTSGISEIAQAIYSPTTYPLNRMWDDGSLEFYSGATQLAEADFNEYWQEFYDIQYPEILNADTIGLKGVSSPTNIFSGGTYFSGTTALDSSIRAIASEVGGGGDETRVQGGTNISTGGTANAPIINLDDDIVLGSVDATTLSGDTIFSGSTDLDATMRVIASEYGGGGSSGTGLTNVQGGTNIFTGGTPGVPVINLEDDISLNSVTSTEITGGTITSLGDVSISAAGSSVGTPRVGAFTDLESGNAVRFQFGDQSNAFQNAFGNALDIYAYHTIRFFGDRNTSGGNIPFSGESNIGSHFINTVATSPAVVIDGASSQTADIFQMRAAGGSLLSRFASDGRLYAPAVDGVTLFSGGTDLDTVIRSLAGGGGGGDGDITRVQGGVNVSTGGTANVPIINLDDDISLGSVNATTLSGSTLFSGSTDLDTVIRSLAGGGAEEVTGSTAVETPNVRYGMNTTTDVNGTAYITLSFPTEERGDSDIVTYSGASSQFVINRDGQYETGGIVAISATTGNYRYTANLRILVNGVQVKELNAAYIRATGGANFTYINIPNIVLDLNSNDYIQVQIKRIGTVSGNAVTEPLQSYVNIKQIGGYNVVSTFTGATTGGGGGGGGGDVTRVTDGINTFTGGTINLPSVNITDPSFNDLTVSGNNYTDNFRLTTGAVTGLFLRSSNNDGDAEWADPALGITGGTKVQGGTNIFTGGTSTTPIVNLEDDIDLGSVNATTLSGGTIFSGSTDLDAVIRSLAGGGGGGGAGNQTLIASCIGEASSAAGQFTKASDIGITANPAGKPLTDPFNSYVNGGLDPWIVVKDGTIDQVTVTFDKGAVGTSTVGSPTFQLDIYEVLSGSRNLLGSFLLPLTDTSSVGIFNNLGGSSILQGLTSGTSISVTGGTMLGVEFANQSGTNDGLNAAGRMQAGINITFD